MTRKVMIELDLLPWRVGRKVRRTLYAQVGPEPSDDDKLIGMLDTAKLAAAAVDAHNRWLADSGR